MSVKQLGRLEQIPVRQIWTNEALDFTPWLAQEENLQLLGKILGLELELEAQEKSVGPFRADLLCRDTLDGSWVLVENQLERTDHNHLGQLMTYAAGLKTAKIVWIADRFTEEHRAALDWLNEITAETFSFFGLEVELWKIGDSDVAPKFNIVSKPNNWSRSVTDAARHLDTQNLNEVQQKKLRFWNNFKKHVEQNSQLNSQTPRVQSYTNFSLGKSGIHLSLGFQPKENKLGVGVYLFGPYAKTYYFLLKREDSHLEQILGSQLIWEENQTTASISTEIDGFDFMDEEHWQRGFEWMLNQLLTWEPFFRSKVRELKTEDHEAMFEAEE